MDMFKKISTITIFSLVSMSLSAREIIGEFKGAYLLATSSTFKEIYKGGALYGPEVTVQLWNDSNWYGYASIDYLHKEGYSEGLDTATTLRLLPLGLGAKYFFSRLCKRADFYVGFGIQPLYVRIKNNSSYVTSKQTSWVCSGIAKSGAYINFPCNFLLDLFIDYTFARISSNVTQVNGNPVTPLKSALDGVIFGAGLGYRF